MLTKNLVNGQEVSEAFARPVNGQKRMWATKIPTGMPRENVSVHISHPQEVQNAKGQLFFAASRGGGHSRSKSFWT